MVLVFMSVAWDCPDLGSLLVISETAVGPLWKPTVDL